jgi:translation elongation factor EF-Tu-like GTPase
MNEATDAQTVWERWCEPYRKPLRLHDVEAQIVFLPADQGGRTTPVRSGYRGQFFYDEHDWDAMYQFPSEWVSPGETVPARLWLLSPHSHRGRLHPGKTFLVREGNRVVGRGQITSIVGLDKAS